MMFVYINLADWHCSVVCRKILQARAAVCGMLSVAHSSAAGSSRGGVEAGEVDNDLQHGQTFWTADLDLLSLRLT